ncbi:amidohydrolase family protein [bacterium]|nr:amidohydrolase family protein [bacterium]
MAESGTTTVLDIANTDHAWEPSRRSGLRVHWFRELLGWRWPARWVSWRAARRSWSEHPDSDRLIAHVSPHAPYSAHPRLIVKAAKWAYRHGKRWGIHLAETVEELDLLATGGGPMRDFLGDFLGRNWRPSRLVALEHLAQISWPRACPPLLFHANHLTAREFDLAARLGVAVVHCPGSHRYYGRTTFPLAEFLSRGIPVFLGTDSLASNQRLDMRREVRLLVEMHPEVGCEAALRMAGRDAAAWLSGAAAPVGLTPGAPADLWWWRLPQSRGLAGPTEALLERLLSTSEASSEVWIAGQAVPARRNLNLYSSP